ncbi:hypothetical protein Q3G72_005711 [Acer saccharum]|nr:hypothetical protein Q3G72_005711 [Acer saccharum]
MASPILLSPPPPPPSFRCRIREARLVRLLSSFWRFCPAMSTSTSMTTSTIALLNTNEYGLETNGGSNNQDPAKIGVGIVDEQPASLDSLSNGGRKTPLDGIGFKASTCNCAGRFSCLRTMTALYLIARIGICSYSIFEEIASDFLSGGLEDHILCSLSLLIERKASGRDSVNFLRLLGIPSFDENSIPGCLRHLNIAPVLGLLKTSGYINLMLPKTPYTLENILHFSPNALKSEWHIRFNVSAVVCASLLAWFRCCSW